MSGFENLAREFDRANTEVVSKVENAIRNYITSRLPVCEKCGKRPFVSVAYDPHFHKLATDLIGCNHLTEMLPALTLEAVDYINNQGRGQLETDILNGYDFHI